ncbi:HAMP domain-containing sensor histidine kinase [Microcella frigidaquae]|uniref:sensor histidine kinase n=1 Tax=Microcella frigidaquae TaxID=424758 RepID=UPI0031D21AD3
MHEQLTQWWQSISLRSKITGVTVFVVTIGLLVVGFGTLTVLQRTLLDEVDRQILEASDDLPESFSVDDFGSFEELTPSAFSNPFYFGAVDTEGRIIDDNVGEGSRAQAPDVSRLTGDMVDRLDGGGMTLISTDRTTQWRVLTFPLRVTDAGSGESSTATLVIGADLTDSNAVIGSFASIFLGFGLVVVILSAALTRILVTSTLRPLRDVEATAARFASGDFSQRLSGATPNTEIGRLSSSLNMMLTRIDSAFADRAATISQMRRFVGDASHELRTPLVSVRGYAELYRMGAIAEPDDVAQAMERIEKEAIRMSALVSDLLELARLDESRPLELTPVDLVPLARDAALDARASAPDRPVTVIVADGSSDAADTTDAATAPASGSGAAAPAAGFAGAAFARLRGRRGRRAAASILDPIVIAPDEAPEAIVMGDENKLRQVITNLMGNAVRFSPAESPIELVVGVDAAAGTASIAVVDHGDGIPDQLKKKIFERFFRADSSRARDTGGSGLGLSIVASIVGLHRGRVDVLDTPGGGATFRVTMPLAEPTDDLVDDLASDLADGASVLPSAPSAPDAPPSSPASPGAAPTA